MAQGPHHKSVQWPRAAQWAKPQQRRIELSNLNLLFCFLAAPWCEQTTHWKRPWCWERLRAGGEGDDRGWDGWMASPPKWTWTLANSERWWGTGKPGVLQSMRLQRVGHNLVIEQQQPCGIGKSYFSNQGWNLNLFLWKRSNHWTTREVPLPQQRKALLSHIPFQGPRDPLLVAEGKGQTSPRVCVCVCMLSCFCCVQLFATLWTVARQAPLSMRFSRQEYWSGLLCPPSGDLPDWGIEPVSLTSNQNWQAGFFFFYH